MKKFLATLVAALVGITGVALAAGPASADTGSDETAFVEKLNELRATRGLPALAIRAELIDVARPWAGRMASVGTISHNPDLAAQAPSNWVRIGENVGVGPNVQSLHDAFVASPLHFRNMIDPEFDLVGVGVVNGPPGIIFVTVNFMKAQGAPQIVQAVAPVANPAGAPAAPAKKARICSRTRRGKVVCRTASARRTPVKARRVRR
ncbi:MAG: CAP domain-containing protein [Acidimicrobiales bacterium]